MRHIFQEKPPRQNVNPMPSSGRTESLGQTCKTKRSSAVYPMDVLGALALAFAA